jgi:serine/threonine protein kinase
MNTLPPGTELSQGKYRIERVLGKGGFGITYQALDVNLKQPIAIKEYCPAENVERSKTGKLTLPNRYIDEFQRGKNKFRDEAVDQIVLNLLKSTYTFLRKPYVQIRRLTPDWRCSKAKRSKYQYSS